jgi:hypothetical protein
MRCEYPGEIRIGPPSSSGLGRRPFTAVARVRIPLGVHATTTAVGVAQSKALWRSWLARRPVTAEVAGSSPVRVATTARHTHAFRPGSSVGTSVRLKSGRSPVRSRPWPPRLMQFNRCFCTVVELRTFESDSAMGPIWGQNEAPPLARLLRCSDLGRRGSRVRRRCCRAHHRKDLRTCGP